MLLLLFFIQTLVISESNDDGQLEMATLALTAFGVSYDVLHAADIGDTAPLLEGTFFWFFDWVIADISCCCRRSKQSGLL